MQPKDFYHLKDCTCPLNLNEDSILCTESHVTQFSVMEIEVVQVPSKHSSELKNNASGMKILGNVHPLFFFPNKGRVRFKKQRGVERFESMISKF